MTERLLLDEQLSGAIADELTRRGHDVASTAADPALRGMPDDQVLELASSQQRIVVTRNIHDFADLDRLWQQHGRTHSGIVYVANLTFPSNRGFVGALVVALDAALKWGSLPRPGATGFLARDQRPRSRRR